LLVMVDSTFCPKSRKAEKERPCLDISSLDILWQAILCSLHWRGCSELGSSGFRLDVLDLGPCRTLAFW
jgi:hypothetical protein